MAPTKQLIEIIRLGLFEGTTPSATLSQERWQSLYEEARAQGVVALLYQSVLSLPAKQRPPRPLLFHLASVASDIEKNMQQHHRVMMQFAEEVYRELGLPTVVVKGWSLARYYSKPYYRESGDNDVYFGDASRKVDALMRQRGIDVDDSDERHSAFLYEGVPFENHSYLMYPQVDKTDGFVDSEWETQELEGQVRTLVPEQLALFVAAHADHHAIYHNESLRLRDMVDWALLISRSGLDYRLFNQIKQPYDVGRFADLLTQYAVEVLGINPPEGWTPLSKECMTAFPNIYFVAQPRSRLALSRVVRRSRKYIRYAGVYKEIYGETMFQRFYYKNVAHAVRQWIKQEPRHQGRQRNDD